MLHVAPMKHGAVSSLYTISMSHANKAAPGMPSCGPTATTGNRETTSKERFYQQTQLNCLRTGVDRFKTSTNTFGAACAVKDSLSHDVLLIFLFYHPAKHIDHQLYPPINGKQAKWFKALLRVIQPNQITTLFSLLQLVEMSESRKPTPVSNSRSTTHYVKVQYRACTAD